MSSADSIVDGWKGKLLRIDLGSGKAAAETISRDVLAKYIGGRGLASRILANEVDPQIDPLDPANKLVISTGPLVGTIAPGASRTHVASKSPLTGLVSILNVGGHFGAALRSAGYDAIVLEGRAKEPIYVRIDGDLVELRDARELWGKTVDETQADIRVATDMEPRQAILPSRTKRPTTRAVAGERAETLCIGPAGERMDRIASIAGSEHWSVGGAGLGAVMGSKRVKAIAVSGCVPATVADSTAFGKAVAAAMSRLKENYVYYRRLSAYGTGAFVRIADERGLLPTLNSRSGSFEGAQSILGEVVADKILKKTSACFGCPCACGRLTVVDEEKGAGPEYEHLFGFGSNCGIADVKSIAKAAYTCRREGLDAVSTAAAIAAVLELADNGAIGNPYGGLELKSGDPQSLARLVGQMVTGEGLGTLMRSGPLHVARELDHPEAFVGLKGQALAAHSMLGDEALILYWATAGDAMVNLPGTLLGKGTRTDDPVAEAIRLQDMGLAIDSAGLCPLIAATFSLDDVAGLLTAATGIDYRARLGDCAAAIWRTERSFGSRAGATDYEALPDRIAQPRGDADAPTNRRRTNELLLAYNQARGVEP